MLVLAKYARRVLFHELAPLWQHQDSELLPSVDEVGKWHICFHTFFPYKNYLKRKSDCNENFIQALQIYKNIKATDCIKVRFNVRVERLLKFVWLSCKFTSWIFLCQKHHCKKKLSPTPTGSRVTVISCGSKLFGLRTQVWT